VHRPKSIKKEKERRGGVGNRRVYLSLWLRVVGIGVGVVVGMSFSLSLSLRVVGVARRSKSIKKEKKKG